MTILIVIVVWLVLSVPVGLFVGRCLRMCGRSDLSDRGN